MIKSIDETELDEFRETLPEDIQDEYFRWLGTGYDVPKALFIISKCKLEKGNVNVQEWCKALGMAGEEKPEAIHLLNGVCDKDVMKENIDPDIPIVIVEHSFKNGRKKEIARLVIDGNKRLRKAFLTKRESIHAYFLPEKLAKLVRF